LVWLSYSNADPSELKPTKTAEVKNGHCYLTYNNDESGRVVTLFHVAEFQEGKSVTINEIEILDRLKAQNK
jgi:hypothetical protein